MSDKWCLELLPDNQTLHFNSCAADISQKNQQFTFGAEEPGNGNGCFGIKAEGNTLTTAWVQDTTSALQDPDILIASPSNSMNIYWLVSDNGDGTLSFVSARVPLTEQWCMDRRDPDEPGRAQLLGCRGTMQQKYTVQPVPPTASNSGKKAQPKR